VSFGMARFEPAGIAVRTHVGPLPKRWTARLPLYLRDALGDPAA
jgi:hypothetical protein